MVVGNFTGLLTLAGRTVGHVSPGIAIRVFEHEKDDPRLIPISQKSLRAVRAMMR